VALLGSLGSMVTVGSVRGLVDRVHQISIVDADAGSTYGYGTAFFGLKTGVDKELDVWLPSNWLSAQEPSATSCFLRPIPKGSDPSGASSSFADPEEYRLLPSNAEVDDVRIRATLKRFEGRWEGPLSGRLTGQVAVRSRQFTEDSYVVNELGVDLKNCYVLHPVLNPGATAGVRDTSIYAHAIGDIPSNGIRAHLAARCYQPRGAETMTQVLQRSTLAAAQQEWSNTLASMLPNVRLNPGDRAAMGLGQEQNALLLLSTIGDFDPASLSRGVDALLGPQTWSRDRLRHLDLRDQLVAGRSASGDQPGEAGSVVLIGFAEDPGPMRLFVRSGDRPYRPLPPEAWASWTMYRIRIPMTRLDASSETREPEEPAERVR